VDKLEKRITHTFENGQEMMYGTIAMLETKLERKENENQTLMTNIAKIYAEELQKISKDNFKDVLDGQDERSKQSEEGFPVELNDPIRDTRVINLERELEETRNALELSTEESLLLEEKLSAKEEQSSEEEKVIKKGSISETEKNKNPKKKALLMFK
jgi:hypothetical protein